MATIRVPKVAESSPRLMRYAVLYGLGRSIGCIPEADAIAKEPKKDVKAESLSLPSASSSSSATEPTQRTLDDTIADLPRAWSWRLDCDNTFLVTPGATWANVCELLAVRDLPFISRVGPLLLGHCSQGLLKCFSTTLRPPSSPPSPPDPTSPSLSSSSSTSGDAKTKVEKETEIALYVQCTGGHTIFIDGKPVPGVFQDAALVKFVDAAWAASNGDALHAMFASAIPDLALRVAFYLVVASNNAIVKASRNHVRYYDVPAVIDTSTTGSSSGSSSPSSTADTRFLDICRRFPHFHVSL